ncbi:glycosyltransferase family 4 protein [Terriglobus tenax]|uniref:glycosyltransferase family 4 protein n=1 Tax=Terriglobus tenax TaxID=1111115 RepID=UPI0021DF52FF|nr:glycosyltransferase family 4 protein [Terriglobus tenax]
MSTSTITNPVQSSAQSEDGHAALRVWFSDPLCFTPWYSAALARALLSANISLRFLSAGISREPEYFSQFGLSPDPGPFRFDHWANGWPSSARRALRCAAAVSNCMALTRVLNRSSETLPDILHLQQLPLLNHDFTVDFKLIAAAQRRSIPVLHTVHNLLPHDTGKQLLTTYRRFYQSVDHLICHSCDVAESLVRQFSVPAGSISVIPHGPLFEAPPANEETAAVARKSLGLPEGRPVVLWQGVMAPYKGVDLLLKAWQLSILRWRRSLAIQPLLVIAGTGAHETEMAARLAEQALPHDIRADLHYIPTSQLSLYYEAADLLVYPYRAITTSGALLTGLSYRKPIIASDLLPFREYLRHNENALLVAPGDAVELSAALTQVMESLCGVERSPSLYNRLLTGAHINNQRYTGWDEIARRTIAVYHQINAGKQAYPKVCKPMHTFPEAIANSR